MAAGYNVPALTTSGRGRRIVAPRTQRIPQQFSRIAEQTGLLGENKSTQRGETLSCGRCDYFPADSCSSLCRSGNSSTPSARFCSSAGLGGLIWPVENIVPGRSRHNCGKCGGTSGSSLAVIREVFTWAYCAAVSVDTLPLAGRDQGWGLVGPDSPGLNTPSQPPPSRGRCRPASGKHRTSTIGFCAQAAARQIPFTCCSGFQIRPWRQPVKKQLFEVVRRVLEASFTAPGGAQHRAHLHIEIGVMLGGGPD